MWHMMGSCEIPIDSVSDKHLCILKLIVRIREIAKERQYGRTSEAAAKMVMY